MIKKSYIKILLIGLMIANIGIHVSPVLAQGNAGSPAPAAAPNVVNVLGQVASTATNPLGTLIGMLGKNAPAWAVDQTIGKGLALITQFNKDGLATILTYLINPIFKPVLEFSNFFTEGVNTGWKTVRDFTNLFFALILLLIAIATVLNFGPLDNYTAKRILPNFIFVALLINFSKAIVGFLIDISQIIMIEFYNAWGEPLGDVVLRISKVTDLGISSEINAAIINLLSIIIIVLLIFILLWTLLILVIRIVTLWISIILSPLAFMSFLVPGLRSLYSEWAKNLQSALVTGPILTFMLYLAITIMKGGGFGIEGGTDNLIGSGAFFNYLIVIALLFAANMIATKAGQQAPPIFQKAVGAVGTVATFGLGAYVGAGGVGTGKMFGKGKELVQGGIKNVDKTLGGATNITGQNARYESAKKDLKEKQKAGSGFVGKFQGFSAEGKKGQLEDFEKQKAIRLFNEGKLEEKGNERYQKMAATLQAATATGVKDEFNVEKLGQDMKKALDDGDKFTAMALSTRVSELKGWSQIFQEDGSFSKYAKENGSEAEQLDAFINDNFERKDTNGKVVGDKITNSFRSRQANILNDKGAGNFAAGLAERDVRNPTYSPAAKAAKAGIIGAGAAYAKNNAIFNVRDTDANDKPAFTNGQQAFTFNIKPILTSIQNESLSVLKDTKSWNAFEKDRNTIKEGLDTELQNPARDTSLDPKIKAALQGLE